MITEKFFTRSRVQIILEKHQCFFFVLTTVHPGSTSSSIGSHCCSSSPSSMQSSSSWIISFGWICIYYKKITKCNRLDNFNDFNLLTGIIFCICGWHNHNLHWGNCEISYITWSCILALHNSRNFMSKVAISEKKYKYDPIDNSGEIFQIFNTLRRIILT